MKIDWHDITDDPESKIATASAECYGGQTSPEANQKRIKQLVRTNHDSTFRFAYATFHISGISRVCSHQLVRTAHAGFLQKSQRYVNAEKDEVIIPESVKKCGREEDFTRAAKELSSLYASLISSGVPKEDARYILPSGIETSIVMTGNFQMWKKWLAARLNRRAQWEIRELASLIHFKLYRYAPNIFGEGE